MTEEKVFETARRKLSKAEAFLVTAGAGMGVDSGLPDFRGSEGFWKAYPPYRHLGFNFMEMANPQRFRDEPKLGWGFYGHRLNLYRGTEPHAGFDKIRRFAQSLNEDGSFLFTSNVDGHFQRAGFDPDDIVECHGSIHHLQCFDNCQGKIWTADETEVSIDSESMRAIDPLPQCPDCGGIARPNVLMFGDYGWNPDRTSAQESRFRNWLRRVEGRKLVILECGAGSAVPSVRMLSEQIAAGIPNATLIRVNPREPAIPALVENGISVAAGALETISRILD